MKYQVAWSLAAERQLAELWLDGELRPQLAALAATLDARLSRDAHEVGESRLGLRRIVHEPPLGAIFRCDEADRRVIVLYLWRFR